MIEVSIFKMAIFCTGAMLIGCSIAWWVCAMELIEHESFERAEYYAKAYFNTAIAGLVVCIIGCFIQ